MASVNRKWYSGMLTQEDWWAVWLGLIMFFAGLLSITGVDLVGWMAKTHTWVNPADGLSASGKAYKDMHPLLSLLITYIVFTALTTTGAYFMKLNVKKFLYGWTIIFAITWACWFIGHEAHFKAVPQDWDKYGITWGLALGGGFSYILALLVGLFIGNFTKGFAKTLYEAAKPEWYIKTAIVFLGIKVGLMTMQAAGFTFELALAGMAATFVAYMLFWPIVYSLGRKVFKLPRQWAATLASGISICGVSAAVATAGAIRARPIIPVMVSMLIVVFAMIELLILPPLYTATLDHEPIVAGAAMGMTVKTDGADAAAGAVLDEMMRAKAAAAGTMWQEGWILTSAIMTKVWIDMFIGLWAFVLAIIWVYKVERKPGQLTVGKSEIWYRFPKFVLGYIFTWLVYVGIAVLLPDLIDAAMVGAKTVQSPMRKMMFMLTFVSIGIITDFSKLKGMGRMALLYAVALFLIIAPIALVVSYVFHHGMMPPAAG
ncbi:putative membrane protein YadS [Desulfohalotomaculum tongense]|uniref:putative sulfate exporter family transporter n=1 Tax=Desulforadius tongensis TaxID=1216062 RepID=UPI00195C38F7|nr:putative sulfate exporter family transporter [Desulforadius tongensis]MBM7855216.1 putative membrane protein YadS [Desulforadius tongensis]